MRSWKGEVRIRAAERAEEVIGVLDALLSGISEALGGGLVGVYLRGSLATGYFIPATSDIDVIAVTRRAADSTDFAALADMHAKLAALPNPYASRIEVAYIDRASLWRFEPGQRHPSIGQGETLEWATYKEDWILERWTVREQGVVLLGPDPKALIAPISSDELCAAVRTRLRDWADFANRPGDPDWFQPLGHTAYVVETMCRALCTMACGKMEGKPAAVAWAIETLPEPWRSLVGRSQKWRTDQSLPDAAIVAEVQSFVRWATADG